MTNRRGQVGAISAVFGLIMFWILWALVIGDLITTWSTVLITNGSLTGIEAFLASQINLFIIIGVHTGAFILAYYG